MHRSRYSHPSAGAENFAMPQPHNAPEMLGLVRLMKRLSLLINNSFLVQLVESRQHTIAHSFHSHSVGKAESLEQAIIQAEG
jgi:hypothetical protein